MFLLSGRWWGIVACVAVYQLSWPSVLQVVLTNPLGRQLCQHVVQVIGVGVAVTCQVRTEFCLVVNLIPHHRVRLACGAGRANGEDEASIPGHDQQLQDLPAFLIVGKVAVSRKPSRTELLPRVGVLIGLNPSWNVIDNADCLGVWVAGQAVGDDMVLHLPRRLGARFLPIDGFACWALKTAILIAIVVHSHQAQQMVHVPTLAKFAHQLWLDAFVLQDAFIA